MITNYSFDENNGGGMDKIEQRIKELEDEINELFAKLPFIDTSVHIIQKTDLELNFLEYKIKQSELEGFKEGIAMGIKEGRNMSRKLCWDMGVKEERERIKDILRNWLINCNIHGVKRQEYINLWKEIEGDKK